MTPVVLQQDSSEGFKAALNCQSFNDLEGQNCWNVGLSAVCRLVL